MFVECSEKEMLEVNGGIIGIDDAIALVGLVIACVAFGYSIGKDIAEKKRR